MKKLLSKDNLIAIISLITIFALAYSKLSEYMVFDFSLILFIMVLPFVAANRTNNISYRYGVASILLLTLFFVLKQETVYFFAVVSTMFFIYESRFGKLTNIPILLLMIISPISQHLNKVIGFEIRLKLTEWAGVILNYIYSDIKQVGNQLIVSGNPFSVDPECMGLNMMVMSLFIGVIFIAMEQKKNKSRYSYLSIISVLILSFLLSSLSNLFRIILLIMFVSPPNTLSHELIGIFSFCLYVVLPLWYVVNKIPSRAVELQQITSSPIIKKITYLILLILLVIFTSIRFGNIAKKELNTLDKQSISLSTIEYTCSVEHLGVLKYEKDGILLYIKPSVNFYSAEHSPLICWRGNGYKIQNESSITVSGIEIYYCTLTQGDDILYSTWWYDSGEDKTMSQFQWRSESMLTGSRYQLVNVISHDKDLLLAETDKMLSLNLFD
ncbi:exosortase N [Candidatus Kapabacteria bacterium]|nr:exosortase N [Candidatus Kapabacteria bacterium]